MNERLEDLAGATGLSRDWESEESFHDRLYEWMQKTPWLFVSLVAHLVLFFILQSVPWGMLKGDTTRDIALKPVEVPPDPFDDTVEPEREELPPVEPIDPVVPLDSNVPVVDDPPLAPDAQSNESPSPFELSDLATNELGLGPGGGSGKLSGRTGPGRPRGGRGTEASLRAGLEWLAHHQHESGFWDADGFDAACGELGSDTCDGLGSPEHDVGVTALALLAFLGEGHTTLRGEYKGVVHRGIAWLRSRQDEASGLVGERSSREFLYDHALASLALCEAYHFTITTRSGDPLLKRSAQKAIDYALAAQNPGAGWRYQVPGNGDNDVSITGWMLFALTSAREAGLTVDEGSLADGLSILDELTDPKSGRVGYDSLGSRSSRVPGRNTHFSPEKGEAMTAVGLLCRIFGGQTPRSHPVMLKHVDLLKRQPPRWDPDGGTDMYYWYYGTYAMFQMESESPGSWRSWKASMEDAIVKNQEGSGDAKGSWDPIGPWGYAGGRVYSTALMVLCLEVYYRYAQVLGAR